MNIVEAIKKADSKHAIQRKGWQSTMRLVPTNSTFLTSMFANDSICNVRWEPSKDDLIADDWEIIPVSLEEIDPLKLAKMLGKEKQSKGKTTDELLNEIIPDIKYIRKRLTPMDRDEYNKRLREITEDR